MNDMYERNYQYIPSSTTVKVVCAYCNATREYMSGEMIYQDNYKVNGKRKLLKFCSYTCRARYNKQHQPHRY